MRGSLHFSWRDQDVLLLDKPSQILYDKRVNKIFEQLTVMLLKIGKKER